MMTRAGTGSGFLVKASRYRHVVFTDELETLRRPMDFGPPAPVEADARHTGELDKLSYEDEAFIRWLLERAELDMRDYKPETLRRRVPACLRAIRASSAAHARHILLRTPSLVPVAIDTLIIGVTSFFRDPRVYDYLATDVLPTLAEHAGGIRVWSVGCSDGAELYSIAMLLAEQRTLHRCYLLGTDCRSDAVKRATAGSYEVASMRGVPGELLGRYFVGNGRQWRLQGWLRTVVQFRTANVLKIIEPGMFDLVLCRNMAIYLQGDASMRLWAGLERAVRPGGVLVTGKAERPVGAKRLSPVAPCVYRRSRG